MRALDEILPNRGYNISNAFKSYSSNIRWYPTSIETKQDLACSTAQSMRASLMCPPVPSSNSCSASLLATTLAEALVLHPQLITDCSAIVGAAILSVSFVVSLVSHVCCI